MLNKLLPYLLPLLVPGCLTGCAKDTEQAAARREELRGWSEFARSNGLKFSASGVWGDSHLLGWSWNGTGSHGQFTLEFNPQPEKPEPADPPASQPNVFNDPLPEVPDGTVCKVVFLRADGSEIPIKDLDNDPNIELLTDTEQQALLTVPRPGDICLLIKWQGSWDCLDQGCAGAYYPPYSSSCYLWLTTFPLGCDCHLGEE